MRVSHSLPTAGIGLALLAAFGFAGQERQPKAQGGNTLQRETRPTAPITEQITVEPVLFTWDDLLKIQASMPKARVATEQLTPISPDLPAIEAPSQVFMQDEVSTPGGGVENMVLCPGFAVEPPIGKQFDAQLDVPDGAGFSFIPPDVTGSVGPDHLMVMLNNKVLVQDRLGGAMSSVDTSVFWSPVGATPLAPTNIFHRVNYDSIHGRWIATARNGANPVSTIFFAISATNNPTGLWTYYSFLADPGAVQFADWVVHGYNQTWIAICADMFNVAGGAFVGPKMWAIDKATALAGGPLTITVFATGYVAAATGVAGSSRFIPSRAFDSSDTDMYVLAGSSFTSGGEAIHQWVRMSGTGPVPVVAPVGPTLFAPPTASFYLIAPAVSFSFTQRVMSQLGEARTMSPFSVRMASVVLRNGRVWAVQSGGNPGPAGNAAVTSTAVIWYELLPAAMPTPVVQSGEIDGGASTASHIPSIAVNCGNDAIIGFSNGDSTRFSRACYTVRLGTDPLNTMGPIRELKAGESNYWKNFGVGSPTICVWGRWSAATVDPVDDKTLWTVQQYADTRVGGLDNDSRWGTHWGRIGSCGAPTINVDPVAQTVCVGDPVTFTVNATAFVAPLAYQWRKDTIPIPAANSTSYSIAATVGGDGGTYDVLVEDGCGTSTSLGALLDFGGASFSAQPADQSVQKGGTANFSVTATGSGTLTYSWRKDTIAISPPETNSSLSVTNVVKADIGVYDCVVTDDCGPTLSDSAVLTIEPGSSPKPYMQGVVELTIFKQPEGGTFCLNTNHTLQVKAYGQNPSYVWRKNTIPTGDTTDTLTFSPVVGGDVGSYDCIVTDASGSITSDPAVIAVTDLVVITMQPVNQTCHIGDSASFSIAVTSDSLPSYQWKKGGAIGPLFNIPGSVADTHSIPSVQQSDFGRYQCAVTNWCGTKLSNIKNLSQIL